MKYLKFFENYDFNDLLAINLSNNKIKDLIDNRFLNEEFKSVYDATNYPEINIEEIIIERKKDNKIPYLQIGIGLETFFEFEKSPKGLEELKKHLLGGKILKPKKNLEDKNKNRIFPSLTIDILLTIHNEQLFCIIDGDFTLFVGDFPLINHSVEKKKYVKFNTDVEMLLIDVLNNLNIYTIYKIQELNKN